MSQEILNELIRKSEGLTAQEKLKLISHLSETLKRQYEFTEKPRQSWREVREILNDSSYDEYAQEWVTRTRSEATEHREQVILNQEQWNKFLDALDAPVEPNPKSQALLQSIPPWEV